MLNQDQLIVCKPFNRIGSSLYFKYYGDIVMCYMPESWESIENKNYIDTNEEFQIRVLWKSKGNNRYTGTIKYID